MQERRLGPFSSSVVRPRRAGRGVGSPTPDQARGPHWRRSSRGLYVPAHVARTPEQRVVEAAAVLPSFGGLTGWAALRWCGGVWFDGLADGGRTEQDVVLATGYADVRNQPGIRIDQERLGPQDLTAYDGLAMTVAPRSVCFAARYASTLAESVVAIDMACFSDLVSLDEAAAYFLSHPGITGIPQARRALALADENSWSPMETRMRLVWQLAAGLPRPLCNRPVFDRSGRHVGTPDLLDPIAGVVGEYDGALHLPGHQRAADVRREQAFRDLGLEYFAVLATDMAGDHRSVVARMEAARARAAWAAPSRRSWTVEPPSWWRPTDTVEQRRALDRRRRTG